MESINICIACDDNYSKYAGVVIASVLENANQDDYLTFYILDGQISLENKDKINSLKSIKPCDINFVEVDNSLFEDYRKIKTHQYISLPAYYRLKLSKLLPNVEKIIYFDCDIIVNRSLSELFNTDLDGKPVAGVKDINKRMLKINPQYVNSGMLLMDLKAIKEQNVEQRFYEWTKEHFDTIKTGDQEIINEVLKGDIKILKDNWNVQSSNFVNRSSYTSKPYIIHFVSHKKPWHFASFSYHKDLYFKYLQLTPWKIPDDEKFYWFTINKILSILNYIKYRPLFLFRPRFWSAIFYTYIHKID